MRIGRGLWLTLVAALLGATAGVTTALVVDDEPGGPTTFEDPLGVGIPFVNLDCTGQAIYVLGYGDTAGAIRYTVLNHRDEDVRYLSTEASCDTYWARKGADGPAYVAYSGPYDDPTEPCVKRMGQKRDDVAVLDESADAYVQCICEIPNPDLPVLEPSDRTNPELAIWVRALQNAFIDLDTASEREGGFREGDVTGIFDELTERRVREFQEESADINPGTGVVDSETWEAITDPLCVRPPGQ
ncbi:MAG: peptidoglycan-binding domain-containing protein [Nocardioides sp.]|nr:peptidoglycan-binding domain-containing protein [Nocardioides sp.]